MSAPLVLSLFPGIGLLDMAFEEEGFCVVRGPDLLWGGDIRRFHPPAGKFQGVIGGPPCQLFSRLRALNPLAGRHGDLIPEFERCVSEAMPLWFVMENVPEAPLPSVPHYGVRERLVRDVWVGGMTSRLRRFSFGFHSWRPCPRLDLDELALHRTDPEPAVLAGHGPALGQRVRGIVGRSWRERARLQGLSAEWIERMGTDAPFTTHGMQRVVGNGVPLPMGRAIAKAVKAALAREVAA